MPQTTYRNTGGESKSITIAPYQSGYNDYSNLKPKKSNGILYVACICLLIALIGLVTIRFLALQGDAFYVRFQVDPNAFKDNPYGEALEKFVVTLRSTSFDYLSESDCEGHINRWVASVFSRYEPETINYWNFIMTNQNNQDQSPRSQKITNQRIVSFIGMVCISTIQFFEFCYVILLYTGFIKCWTYSMYGIIGINDSVPYVSNSCRKQKLLPSLFHLFIGNYCICNSSRNCFGDSSSGYNV